MREPSDPLYDPTMLEVSNDLEVLLGQIRMLLFTKPGDIIARLNFGIDLESMVFSTNVSTIGIEEYVSSQIYQFCPSAASFDVKTEVIFFEGNSSDTCLIDIFVNGTKYLGVIV